VNSPNFFENQYPELLLQDDINQFDLRNYFQPTDINASDRIDFYLPNIFEQ
ncbi:15902_t:CDS:1, partial [Acaulospora colombiana]